MFLLVFHNVRSERELMDAPYERLDCTIDTSIPDYSFLSKARKRWGEDLFKTFFDVSFFNVPGPFSGSNKDLHG